MRVCESSRLEINRERLGSACTRDDNAFLVALLFRTSLKAPRPRRSKTSVYIVISSVQTFNELRTGFCLSSYLDRLAVESILCSVFGMDNQKLSR